MTDVDNAKGIYLPPGADESDRKKSEFLASYEEDDQDLLSIEDDLNQLLSDASKKPPKPPQKAPPPSPSKRPLPAQRPTPAPRAAGGAGKPPPKPAPRKAKAPSTDGSRPQAESVGTMDDGDILKYIQNNAGDQEPSLDLF